MRVRDHAGYDGEFPEKFPWESVNERSLCEIGPRIAQEIAKDFGKERRLVPGLRMALNCIAQYATVGGFDS